jgi:8-oxo-dGTP pyrophosphatase MutT (NUDIX family)
MKEHYKTLSAVFPIIIKTANGKKQVLLHKRENTGYMDGMWDLAGSGHVDENETAMQTVIRECMEETKINIEIDKISFAHLSHRVNKDGLTYYDIYFFIHDYNGVPSIAEPDKCSCLEWFDTDDLPADMIQIRKNALENYFSGVYYSEVIC